MATRETKTIGMQRLANVAHILDRMGLILEAERLSLSNKQVMVEVGKMYIFEKCKPHEEDERRGKTIMHTLLALENARECRWKRSCIAHAILLQGRAFMQKPALLDHGCRFDMQQFFAMYRENIKGMLKLAREAQPNALYTFHIVYRMKVNEERMKKKGVQMMNQTRLQKAIKDHDGEIAVHRFVCLPDMMGALRFFQRWSLAQRLVEGNKATCLMECGPPDDTMKRKWIIDVDAAYKDLKAFGLLLDPSVCSEQVRLSECFILKLSWLSRSTQDRLNLHQSVIRMGTSISQFLQTVGFTRTRCSFALKTRHQRVDSDGSYKKLSWHLTLMAFASNSEWRNVMQFTEKKGYPTEIKNFIHTKKSYLDGSTTVVEPLARDNAWLAVILADSHVLSNTKGQYLQTLHSEKVDPGNPASGEDLYFLPVFNLISKGLI